MSLFMCFFPLLWGAAVVSRFRLRFSTKEILLTGFRSLWTFFFLFLFVLLHQSKTIGGLTVFSSYSFYFNNFGFLPYFFLILFLTAVFHLFLKRRYTFGENFIFLMTILFLTEVFRVCYFQNQLNVFQALGQPFLDTALMTMLTDTMCESPLSRSGRKKFFISAGTVTALSLVTPFFGVATEYGWGWIAVNVALFCFLLFRFLFLKKYRPVLYV